MLSTRNITYSIGTRQILKGISLDFIPGEFTMVLGPNGSGKSSFLKIFSGQVATYGGSVSYGNRPLNQISKEELAKQRAVMSQQTELSFPLTVEEVVMMGRYPYFTFNPGKKDIDICNEVMERMNLGPFRYRDYTTLSGGEKQRVQYARVLSHIWEPPASGTRYLYLDEPLNNLDLSYQHELLQIAGRLRDQGSVLVAVMHDINLAIQYADKLVFIKEGKLVAHGGPGIIHPGVVEKVFNVKTVVISNPVNGRPLVIYP